MYSTHAHVVLLSATVDCTQPWRRSQGPRSFSMHVEKDQGAWTIYVLYIYIIYIYLSMYSTHAHVVLVSVTVDCTQASA